MSKKNLGWKTHENVGFLDKNLTFRIVCGAQLVEKPLNNSDTEDNKEKLDCLDTLDNNDTEDNKETLDTLDNIFPKVIYTHFYLLLIIYLSRAKHHLRAVTHSKSGGVNALI